MRSSRSGKLRSIWRSKPFSESTRRYSSRVIPGGVGKSGKRGWPNTNDRLQRLAISTEFAIAIGRSAKRFSISSWDKKYCSSLNFFWRRGLPKSSPSAMQTRASCAVKSLLCINCTGCVATTGKSISLAIWQASWRCCSSCGCPPRCTSIKKESGKILAQRPAATLACSSCPARSETPTSPQRPPDKAIKPCAKVFLVFLSSSLAAGSANQAGSTSARPRDWFSKEARLSNWHRLR